jgi:hypothetical protein
LYDNGVKNSKKRIIKTIKTKNETIIDGKTLSQICSEKSAHTSKTTILDNGLTISQNGALKSLETMKNTFDVNGMNLIELRTLKMIKTKSIIGIDGLDSYERGFKNGAGKNSSLKYYNTKIYYQGNYEKDFLDKISELNMLSEIERGDRIKYININEMLREYRSDFKIRNIIFEIKSDYIYGSLSKYHKSANIINQMNNKRINNNLKFKNTLEQGKKVVLVMNKNYYLELTLNMLNDITIDLCKLDFEKMSDIKNIF